MFVERREPASNTPSGWAGTLRRDPLAPWKLRLDPRWSIIRKHIEGPVLDAGCGRGDWVAFLAAHGYSAVGLDYSQQMIEANRLAFPGLRFEEGRIQATPFSDGEFGGIISWGVIEHDVNGPGDALAEFNRILRPGGRAFVTVPVDSEVQRRASQVQFPAGNEFFQHFFTIEELATHVSVAGFRIVSSGYCSRPHPALVWPARYDAAGPIGRRWLQLRAARLPLQFGNMIYCLGEKA